MDNIKSRIKEVLPSIQQRLRLDVRYVAQASFWTVLNQSLSGVLSLGLTIAFANLLPKETYGTYRYILSLAGVLNILTLTGMSTAITRAVARGDDVLRGTIRYQLRWNLLMTAGFFSMAGYYFFKGADVFAISFCILGVFIPSSIALFTCGAYLEGKKEFKTVNILRSLSTLMYTAGTLVVLFFQNDTLWLIGTYTFTTFFASVAAYAYTMHRFKPAENSDPKDTVRYARDLTLLKFIDPVASQIDKVILGNFWGSAQLATYALATAIPNRAMLYMKNWVGIGLPKFATKTPAELDAVLYRRILQGMLLGLPATLLYVLLAPTLFTYVLPQYMESVVYSQWLSLTLIFAIPNRFMSHLFASQKLTKIIAKRAVIGGVMNVVLYSVLGIWGGISGLVTATLLISTLGLLLAVVLWKGVVKKGLVTPNQGT